MIKLVTIFLFCLAAATHSPAQHLLKKKQLNTTGNSLSDPKSRYDYIDPYHVNGLVGVIKNNKHGLMDTSDRELAPCIYDNELFFHRNISRAERDSKQGLVDTSGKEVVPCIYDEFRTACLGFEFGGPYIAKKNDKYGIYSDQLQLIVPVRYADIQYLGNNYFAMWDSNGCWLFHYPTLKKVQGVCMFHDYLSTTNNDMIAVLRNKKWGFIDTNGILRVQCIYDAFHSFSDSLAAVKKDGKWGYIDKDGNCIITPKYLNAGPFQLGKAEVILDSGSIIINKKGELLPDNDFVHNTASRNNTIAITKNGKWGIKDLNGNMIIPFEYDGAHPFKDGLAAVSLNYKWGYVNRTGKVVIPFILSYAEEFKDGYLVVNDVHGKTIYDTAGNHYYKLNEAIPGKYSSISVFYQKRASVRNDQAFYGFINRKGKEIIPCIYETVSDFSRGIAMVKKDSTWGYINKRGKVIIPFIYADARPFYKGLAPVKLNGKYGFINKKGKVIIPFQFDNAGTFYEDSALVQKGNKHYYLDHYGNLSDSLIYTDEFGVCKDLCPVNIDNKWGFTSKDGTIIIPPKYIEVRSFNNGFASVLYENQWGVINRNGKLIIPCIYNKDLRFINGLAVAELYSPYLTYGALDTNGKEVLPFESRIIGGITNKFIITGNYKGNSISNRKGKLITKSYYNSIEIGEKGPIAVEKNKRWGYINRKGKELRWFK